MISFLQKLSYNEKISKSIRMVLWKWLKEHDSIPLWMVWLLLASITVAMVSRIAKNFQDYFLNVVIQKFGAKVFTRWLATCDEIPYQQFEDQRSGETLSVLTKVRADVEKFMINFINILFGVIVGVSFRFCICCYIYSLEHSRSISCVAYFC